MLWSIPLHGVGKWLPSLCITHSGQLIIGNYNQFPSQFEKDPVAICVDSRDQVLVMDDATRKISLFSADGAYIQPIMQKDGCDGMSLYLDKYILMTTASSPF